MDIGFLFDWDGVVIDSHAQHEESWALLSAELGRPLPEGFFKKTFGMTQIPVDNFFEAENGKVGLEVLSKNWVDVIFLDINMPVMNGMEFMKCLKADEKLRNTPVIVVSTEGSKERKDELLNAGIRAYLRKPVTPEHLVETITEVLGAGKNE